MVEKPFLKHSCLFWFFFGRYPQTSLSQYAYAWGSPWLGSTNQSWKCVSNTIYTWGYRVLGLLPERIQGRFWSDGLSPKSIIYDFWLGSSPICKILFLWWSIAWDYNSRNLHEHLPETSLWLLITQKNKKRSEWPNNMV